MSLAGAGLPVFMSSLTGQSGTQLRKIPKNFLSLLGIEPKSSPKSDCSDRHITKHTTPGLG